MNITLRQIEIFLLTAKLGNLSKAAEKLCITQAAASMALKEFELQLNGSLFDRIGKKLIINENGRAVVPVASEIIGRSTELINYFSGEAQLMGDLVIGASSSIGNYVIPEHIAEFSQQHPQCSINLQVGNTEEIIQKVLKFEVDAGVIEGFCYEPKISVIPWMDDELVVFSSTHHPLAHIRSLTREDLQSCAWVLRERGSGTRDILENQLNAISLDIKVFLELGHTEAIKNVIANGTGISCLSKHVLSDLAQMDKIKLLDTPFLNLERKFFLLLHRDKYRTAVLNQFLSQLGLDPQSS